MAEVVKVKTFDEGTSTITRMGGHLVLQPPTARLYSFSSLLQSIVLAFLDLGYISHSVTLSVHLRCCGIQAFLLLYLPAREYSRQEIK